MVGRVMGVETSGVAHDRVDGRSHCHYPHCRITAATSKAPRSPAKSPAKSPRAASPAKSPVPHMAPASPKKADAPVPAASALPATATTSEVERARQRAERFGIPVAAVDGPKAAVAAVPRYDCDTT